MRSALYFINSLAVFFILLSVSVFVPAFSKGFYSHEYDKYRIPESIGVSKSDLMRVTDNLIGYMKGKYPELDAQAVINGEYRPFFNTREISHMADVKGLINGGFVLTGVSIAVVIAVCVFTFLSKGYAYALRRTLFSMIFILLAFALAVAVTALNFENAFVIFHKLFFNNDLWVLNPETDLLINIVPLEFFIDISGFITVIFTVLGAAALTALAAAGKKLKRV